MEMPTTCIDYNCNSMSSGTTMSNTAPPTIADNMTVKSSSQHPHAPRHFPLGGRQYHRGSPGFSKLVLSKYSSMSGKEWGECGKTCGLAVTQHASSAHLPYLPTTLRTNVDQIEEIVSYPARPNLISPERLGFKRDFKEQTTSSIMELLVGAYEQHYYWFD
ncbi:unnamed protein product [Ceratitis capitata]|uniref:(Mediterranean fruit fly) hypothetical protein n=1 Tax=Ceratitis capitata TaxID=7213 RepID=A0A811U2H1_CERCA|nr:unnamed protein product [Ceratitis capitata]